MQENLQAKEDYLTREIAEKGMKKEDFLEYLKSQKENGNDLGKWTIEEITGKVQEYHQMHETKTVQEDNSPIVIEDDLKLQNYRLAVSNTQENKEHPVEEKNLPNIEERDNEVIAVTQNNGVSKEEDVVFTNEEKIDTRLNTQFGRMSMSLCNDIQCLQLDKTEFSDAKNVLIKLSFPEKKFAKKLTISFAIETLPLNFKVRRTVNDFIWLRGILKRSYPGIFIPPLSKNSIGEATPDSKVEKKMLHYQTFLNNLVQCDVLRTSKFFHDFLTTVTEKEFQLKMQAYDKMPFPKVVTQLQSKTGTIAFHPEILDDTERTAKTNNVIQSSVQLFTQLNKSFKSLIRGMKLVNNSLYDLSEVFKGLIASAKEYDNSNPYIKQYEGLKDAFTELYYNNQKQTFVYDMKLKQHFKYVLKEYIAIKELRDAFQASKASYYKTKDKILKKKEELFLKKDMKQWNLRPEDTTIDKYNKTVAFEKMLPQETHALFEEKQFCCFLGCSFETEFAKVRDSLGKKSKVNIKESTETTLDINQAIKNIWDELVNTIESQS